MLNGVAHVPLPQSSEEDFVPEPGSQRRKQGLHMPGGKDEASRVQAALYGPSGTPGPC